MAKQKQLRNEFDALYSRKHNPWSRGGTVPAKQRRTLPKGFWASLSLFIES